MSNLKISPNKLRIMRAEQALKLNLKIQQLSQTLNQEKKHFRDLANGEKDETVVTGLGYIRVSKPSEAKSFKAPVFDEDKFNALTKEMQKVILASGCVKIEKITKAEGTPSVSFIYNK